MAVSNSSMYETFWHVWNLSFTSLCVLRISNKGADLVKAACCACWAQHLVCLDHTAAYCTVRT